MIPVARRQVSSVASSSSDAITTSSSGTVSQTPSSTSTSSPTSVTSLSGSAQLTTSSSSTETPSTSSPTSTSPSSSSVPSTTSPTPTSTPTSSSPSSASHTTSLVSSSVPSSFSTTTAPPTSSSSQQGTLTTITSAYTTYIDGSPVATTTTFPSIIPDPSTPSSSNRTAIIAGSAAGGTALLILILTLAFCIRRQRFKRLDFLDTITLRSKQARERATFLDGEDLDDARVGVGQRYTDYDPATGPRWSDSGSAFRENVWPPPLPHESTRLMDPDADNIGHDLSRIVDEVMGPSPAAGHYSDRSVSSMYMYRASVADSASEGQGLLHSRTVSNASHAALLEAAGLGAATTTNVPVRSSPLAQQGTQATSVEQHPLDTPSK